ncbi:MAG TPA: hypothetical protein P5110_01705 [Candidatus Omnitrophota bacterium]|nr:hypothetical protein [Candidatus Omnitrophota bacterium]
MKRVSVMVCLAAAVFMSASFCYASEEFLAVNAGTKSSKNISSSIAAFRPVSSRSVKSDVPQLKVMGSGGGGGYERFIAGEEGNAAHLIASGGGYGYAGLIAGGAGSTGHYIAASGAGDAGYAGLVPVSGAGSTAQYIAASGAGDAGYAGLISSGSSMTPEQWKAWKAWQKEDASHTGVHYSTYVAYQPYKDQLTFTEYEQYKKDSSGSRWEEGAGFALHSSPMSAEQWKAWKEWQGEDQSQAGASYATYKAYQQYEGQLTFTEYEQYKKDTSGSRWEEGAGFALHSSPMSAEQWKAWRTWQGEDQSQAGASYATYKAYQPYKDQLTFTEYQEYIKDARISWNINSFGD